MLLEGDFKKYGSVASAKLVKKNMRNLYKINARFFTNSFLVC